MYDVSEELITGQSDIAPLVPLVEQERVQINVRRIQLPWLGTHVLYVEEYPYDEPFELRRRVLLNIEHAPDGTLRVRQFTRKSNAGFARDADPRRHRNGGRLRSVPAARWRPVSRRHARAPLSRSWRA